MLVGVDALVIDHWHEVSTAELERCGGAEDEAIPLSSGASALDKATLPAGLTALGGVTMNALRAAHWIAPGLPLRFVGFCGRDRDAILQQVPLPAGVDLVLHDDPSCLTQQVTVLVPPSKKRSILFEEDGAPTSGFALSHIAMVCEEVFSASPVPASEHLTANVLYASSWANHEVIKQAMLGAAVRGWEIVFNLGSTHLPGTVIEAVSLSSVVIGNADEWRALAMVAEFGTDNVSRIAVHAASLEGTGRRRGRIVVVTSGEGATIIVDRDGRLHEYTPPTSSNLVDTTAAGDGFAGGFLCGLLFRKGIHECVRAGFFVAQAVIGQKHLEVLHTPCSFSWTSEVLSEARRCVLQSCPRLPAVSALTSRAFLAFREHLNDEYNWLRRSLLSVASGISPAQQFSILDIGSGDGTILEHLLIELGHQDIGCINVDAFEPVEPVKFSARLSALPRVDLHQKIFTTDTELSRKYNLVVLCHSLYGHDDRLGLLLHAVRMLADGGQLVVFHRREAAERIAVDLSLALAPPYKVELKLHDAVLLADVLMQDHLACSCLLGADLGPDEQLRLADELGPAVFVRDGTRELGMPTAMVRVYVQSEAGALEVLAKKVRAEGGFFLFGADVTADHLTKLGVKKISAQARACRPRAVCQPRTEEILLELLTWASTYSQQLSVCSGGHSDHCLADGAVAIHMGAWSNVIVDSHRARISAGGGTTVGEVCRVAADAGFVIPLGARPSVGMGLALLGGMGHHSRSHGLSIDNIIALRIALPRGGIVVANCNTNQELFFAARGAAPCFGVVLELTFRCSPILPVSVCGRHVPLPPVQLGGWPDASVGLLSSYSKDAASLADQETADAFVCWEAPGQMAFKLTCFSSVSTPSEAFGRMAVSSPTEVLDPPYPALFERELYMTFNPATITGAPVTAKVLTYKRCVLLRGSWDEAASALVLQLVCTAPTKLCYIHFVHCGGAVSRVAPEATAFGHRNWEFAAVVTGIWAGTGGAAEASAAKEWVREASKALLSCRIGVGIYGADLGPGDAAFAMHAFGANLPRLQQLKDRFDPHGILGHACPLPARCQEPPMLPPQFPPRSGTGSTAVVISGPRFVGKDHFAAFAASVLRQLQANARVVSISSSFKQRYCAEVGADLERLETDRLYKEQHRAEMQVAYDREQSQGLSCSVRSFAECASGYSEAGSMITFVTGLREPDIRGTVSAGRVPAVTILISAPDGVRERRGWIRAETDQHPSETSFEPGNFDLTFENGDLTSDDDIRGFVVSELVPRLVGLRVLAPTCEVSAVAQRIPTVMTEGFAFKHILAPLADAGSMQVITRELCRRIEQSFGTIDAVVVVESTGFLLGGALAAHMRCSLLPLCKTADKLPPPRASMNYGGSFVSGGGSGASSSLHAWEGHGLLAGSRCVLVDDTVSTGSTASAAFALITDRLSLNVVGVACVLEFPYHRGRERIAALGGSLTSMLAYEGP